MSLIPIVARRTAGKPDLRGARVAYRKVDSSSVGLMEAPKPRTRFLVMLHLDRAADNGPYLDLSRI